MECHHSRKKHNTSLKEKNIFILKKMMTENFFFLHFHKFPLRNYTNCIHGFLFPYFLCSLFGCCWNCSLFMHAPYARKRLNIKFSLKNKIVEIFIPLNSITQFTWKCFSHSCLFGIRYAQHYYTFNCIENNRAKREVANRKDVILSKS